MRRETAGHVFLVATLRRGAVEMSVAVGVEIIFAAVTVGIYSAFIQVLRFARPRRLANLAIGIGLPGVLLMLDYLARRLGTAEETGVDVCSNLPHGVQISSNKTREVT